ncbi:DUF2938 domain-containing protein [Aquicoccus porphyridii]|uniref:DUF2938 domain-containing protein n=1 Tax=Aquicoccus porphyridii TaxID=1852029 RepID=A0A5A9ZUY1_9RHOB|nr:DUF2938 domain-containing protein [Aquicoccus porphyridii]KAA0921133.1 DUF2938 domain-containing protein [Aquicoccus porphyridii]RAI56332.1 DUF2938 domain-containing protein [Rhodobacteraceae bacterium AsT-22]
MGELLLESLILGVGATLFMDLVALALRYGVGVQPLDYALVGRWFGHLLRGQVRHRPITASPVITGERWIGWVMHYLIGVVFAVVFLTGVGEGWLATPRLDIALAFGAVTVLAPFLVLQPAMGAGLAARRTPRPGIARLKSLLAHLSFGMGLWVAAILWPAAT